MQNVINLTALKVFPEAERYESIKQSKLCLTKEQMLGKWQSETTCKVNGCTKRHLTSLYRTKITDPVERDYLNEIRVKIKTLT